jgi:hypothetical protein
MKVKKKMTLDYLIETVYKETLEKNPNCFDALHFLSSLSCNEELTEEHVQLTFFFFTCGSSVMSSHNARPGAPTTNPSPIDVDDTRENNNGVHLHRNLADRTKAWDWVCVWCMHAELLANQCKRFGRDEQASCLWHIAV